MGVVAVGGVGAKMNDVVGGDGLSCLVQLKVGGVRLSGGYCREYGSCGGLVGWLSPTEKHLQMVKRIIRCLTEPLPWSIGTYECIPEFVTHSLRRCRSYVVSGNANVEHRKRSVLSFNIEKELSTSYILLPKFMKVEQDEERNRELYFDTRTEYHECLHALLNRPREGNVGTSDL
ncbi:hypothetical protein Tco_0046945 [Tanacetum coccineum]